MSVSKVIDHMKKFNEEKRVQIRETSCATVPLAAQTLGVEEARIAKTMSFNVNGDTVLIVTAGDTKIDNAKFKAFFKTKARMLPFEEAEEKTGHAPGGVCPFGVKEGVRTYLDESLKRFRTVFPAAGDSNAMMEVTPDELYTFSECSGWVDVSKLSV